MNTRTRTIIVRLTNEEYAMVLKAASDSRSVSDFVRQRLLSQEEKCPTESIADLSKKIDAIYNRLWEL